MAQISYGTITITDTNDIEKIYMEYAQSTSNQTAPTSGWDDDIPTWRQGYYIWQRTVTKMSGVPLSSDSYGEPVCLTGSTGSTGAPGQSVDLIVTTYCNYGSGTPAESYSGWQSTVPVYDSAKPNYWVKTVITYSNPTDTDVIIYKDNGITSATSTAAAAWNKADQAQTDAGNALSQATAANNATALLGGHFIYNTTWSTNKTPHSANVVQNIGTDGIYEQTPSQWQYNTHVGANGIKLRYNEIDLSSWTDSGLIFYNPSNSSQGNKMMELSSSALKFFDVNNSTNPLMSLSGQALNFYQYGTNTAAATLDSNGLKIVKGSIKLGSNFEVNSSGVLIAKSGAIGGWTINSSYGIYTNGKTTATSTNTGILIQKDGAIYAGAYNSTNQACPFQVTSAGALTATSGSIAGWSFNGTSLYKNNTTPGASSNTMVISTGAASRNSIGGSSGDHDWMLSAGTGFGVTTNGVLYATGGSFNGRIEATEGYFSSTVTIGNGGTTLSTIEANAKQSQIYPIGVNDGTTGYHFLGTLTLSGQTAEAEIEIHTGAGQNNGAYQNLTVRVNIKRGYQATTTTTAGITVRYEGNPTIITMGESNCSIIARCTTVGVLNIYMYTPNWGYADGWYQVKGRNWSWVHSGTLVTTAPSEGTAQSITYMNPYTTATNYITDIDSNNGITIKALNGTTDDTNTGNYIKLNTDGLNIYRNGESVAFYGETARIGVDDNNYSNVQIGDDAITMYNKGVETYKIENATNHMIKRVVSPYTSLEPTGTGAPTTYETYIPVAKNKTLTENQIANGQIIITYITTEDDENYQSVTTTHVDTYTGLERNITKANYYTFTSEIIREGEFEGAKATDISVSFTISSSFPTTTYFQLNSIEINYIVDEIVVQNTIGAYANTSYSGPFKIGNGDGANSTSNALLVDYDNDVRIGGDVYVHCNEDSTGGMSLGTVKTYYESYTVSGFRELWIEAYQIGYTVTLTIGFHKTAATAASQDYFNNLIVNNIPAPAHRDLRISTFGYSGGYSIGYWFAMTGDPQCWRLNARNLSSTTVSNIGATASMTYVTDGTLCGDVW